jgi:phosphoglycerate dehydrogenase-like enzyme
VPDADVLAVELERSLDELLASCDVLSSRT